MKKLSLHLVIRILYYLTALLILIKSIYSMQTSNLILNIDDYIFLFILCISFVLINKYSIGLKDTNLVLNDFIIQVLYITFGIHISLIILFLCYLIIFLIEYDRRKKLNLLMENVNIFNNALFLLSTYSAHLIFSFLNNIFAIETYQLVFTIIFGFMFLICNYILFCIDLSLHKNKLALITLQDGLYYIFLNFFICTVIAYLSLYLYKFYGYVPVIVLTCFIIFISFAANNIEKLKLVNKNIKALSDCSTFIVTPNLDFKTKLKHVLEVLETITPFVYSGIYFYRENYKSIFPVCYRSTYGIALKDTRFIWDKDCEIVRRIQLGNPICTENHNLKNNIAIVSSNNPLIKSNMILPIKNSNSIIGFILICLGENRDYNDEMDLLSSLGKHIGMVNFYLDETIKNNSVIHKDYDALTKYMDYNISKKIFFSLAIIEIINFAKIINNYNSDFYLTYRNEITKLISKQLSHNDYILCFEKEYIYIIFNALDSTNSLKKLEEIKTSLENYNFKDIVGSTQISYAVCEYPIEGINTDEILSKTYRKLYKEKTPN